MYVCMRLSKGDIEGGDTLPEILKQILLNTLDIYNICLYIDEEIYILSRGLRISKHCRV